MNLYRFEATLNDHKIVHVIVAAENDDAAFEQVEVELERHFLKLPEIKDITLYDRKEVKNGSGFVILPQVPAV